MTPDTPRSKGTSYTYSRVMHRFWRDERVRRWPDDRKVFFLYALTSEHRHLEGIFHLPLDYIASDLGWPLDKVEDMIASLTKDGLINYDFEAEIILIRNVLKFERPQNPPVQKGVVRRLHELPTSPLLQEFLAQARRHLNGPAADSTAKEFLALLEQEFGQQPSSSTAAARQQPGRSKAPVGQQSGSEGEEEGEAETELKAETETEDRRNGDGKTPDGVSHLARKGEDSNLLKANAELQERRKALGIT